MLAPGSDVLHDGRPTGLIRPEETSMEYVVLILRELAGDVAGARADYLSATRLTRSQPEQRYLARRAARLAGVTTIGQVRREPGAR